MNTQKLIQELHRENLCTYFILPLLRLNKKSFVHADNFINSYLTRDGDYIFVRVNDTLFFMEKISMHPLYLAIWKDLSGGEYIQFSIPAKWQKDVQTFIKGKYSQLSAEAKEMIQQHSGLLYRVRRIPDNVPITDVRLLALDRSVAVRDLWAAHYGLSFDEEDELLSIAEGKAFINMELLFKEDQPLSL